MKELISLSNFGCSGSAIDSTTFPSDPTGGFWTSTHSDSGTWTVQLWDGSNYTDNTVGTTLPLRCVR